MVKKIITVLKISVFTQSRHIIFGKTITNYKG